MSRPWIPVLQRWLFFCIIATLTTPVTTTAEESYNQNTGIAGASTETPLIISPEQSSETAKTTSKRNKRNNKESGNNEAIKEPTPNEKMTVAQVLEIMKTTRDLSGRNLSGLSLIGLNMSRSNLKGADFKNANLERVDFTESNLERVDFKGANLKMASFFESAITAADMEQAILDNAIWTDKRVCAKGSIGRCLESELPTQPVATK